MYVSIATKYIHEQALHDNEPERPNVAANALRDAVFRCYSESVKSLT